MGVEYSPAPEVEKIAGRLIDSITQHHILKRVHVEYVFRSEAAKKNGRAVLGSARKKAGLDAYLLETARRGEAPDPEEDVSFFVIEIAQDYWTDLDTAQRKALVDHELCHCIVDEADDLSLKLSIRAHDLEEFMGVVERHGLWMRDVDLFVRVATKQMSLLDPAE